VEAATVLLLVGAGLAGGVITAIVGGSSLLTFPALLAAGLPPILANSSSTVAMTPSTLAAAVADRESIPAWNRGFAAMTVVAFAGSVAGAWLLLWTPEAAFTGLVPALVGGATALFAYADHIKRLALRHASRLVDDDAPGHVARLAMIAPIAVYGGYFGAAMGVMLLSVLALGRDADFRRINAVKNLLGTLIGLVAAAIFVWRGAVAWPQALAVMLGALVGGFLGGRLVRVLPPGLLRSIVIVVGSGLALYYAWRYWRV
jgi:uncharacterized membrane protein YfcA